MCTTYFLSGFLSCCTCCLEVRISVGAGATGEVDSSLLSSVAC